MPRKLLEISCETRNVRPENMRFSVNNAARGTRRIGSRKWSINPVRHTNAPINVLIVSAHRTDQDPITSRKPAIEIRALATGQCLPGHQIVGSICPGQKDNGVGFAPTAMANLKRAHNLGQTSLIARCADAQRRIVHGKAVAADPVINLSDTAVSTGPDRQPDIISRLARP